MTVSEIKLLAFNQADPPADMNMAEQILYLTLSDVYRRFLAGEISQSEGEQLFQTAASKFKTNSAVVFLHDQIAKNHAEMWKRIESAAAAYVMSGNRTPEADAFMEAVYGCKLKQKGSDIDEYT